MTSAKAPAAPRDRNEAIKEWLSPLKKKLADARSSGASLSDIRAQINAWKPDTRALAGALADNIANGLQGRPRGNVGAANDNTEEVAAKHEKGCNQYSCKKGCQHKGTTRERRQKDINNTPKLAPENAKVSEKEKALKRGIEWVKTNRKSLYGVCYVKSIDEKGKDEILPLDLHLDDIIHAEEHKDIAQYLWRAIGRGKRVIRDTETDEVYRYGTHKVVLRDYIKGGKKRKKIVTHYTDKAEDKKR